MAIVVAQEVLARRYEARLFSLASLFHFACYVALIIIPFVISYTSQCTRTAAKPRRAACAAACRARHARARARRAP